MKKKSKHLDLNAKNLLKAVAKIKKANTKSNLVFIGPPFCACADALMGIPMGRRISATEFVYQGGING